MILGSGPERLQPLSLVAQDLIIYVVSRDFFDLFFEKIDCFLSDREKTFQSEHSSQSLLSFFLVFPCSLVFFHFYFLLPLFSCRFSFLDVLGFGETYLHVSICFTYLPTICKAKQRLNGLSMLQNFPIVFVSAISFQTNIPATTLNSGRTIAEMLQMQPHADIGRHRKTHQAARWKATTKRPKQKTH